MGKITSLFLEQWRMLLSSKLRRASRFWALLIALIFLGAHNFQILFIVHIIFVVALYLSALLNTCMDVTHIFHMKALILLQSIALV
jgi:hypothetical protein